MITQIQDQLRELKQENLLAQVARAAGLADRTIYRIANGDTKDCRISTLTSVLLGIQMVRSRQKVDAGNTATL